MKIKHKIKLCKLTGVLAVLFAMAGCAQHNPAPVTNLARDYSDVQRGSYRGSFYQVRKGDTLYFIAYITGKNINDIVSYNNLKKPYTIFPGQKLKLWHPNYQRPTYGKAEKISLDPSVSVGSIPKVAKVTPSIPSPPQKSQQSATQKNNVTPPRSTSKNQKPVVEAKKTKEYVDHKKSVKPVSQPPKEENKKISKWLWPTKGRVVNKFTVGEQGNKGIDIAGQRGQAIMSTASGTVVYSGNALRGYGNLVIIKHNDDYLSAYAHNDRLLVKEGQTVKAGQKIATMGSSGSRSVMLHFEIRYQGKSVNPNRYLP